jgi:hypothetical protein
MNNAIKEQKNQTEIRGRIVQLEAVMKELPEDQKLHIEPKHYFAPGIYMREMTMPKGSIVVGKIHKTEHLWMPMEMVPFGAQDINEA